MRKTYPVLGHSMRFTLEPGDRAAAEPCDPAGLRAGELALLVKWEGGRPTGYVIHRVMLNFSASGRRLFLTKGDANLLPDLPPAAFQPAGRVTALGLGGALRDYSPGFAWPLACAYSFFANKFLTLAHYADYFAFRAAARLLPGAAAPALNSLQLFWETSVYPGLLGFAAAALRPAGAAPAAGQVKTGRIISDETWSGEITVADYLMIAPGARVHVEPGTRVNFTRAEPWFFPVLRAGSCGCLELDSARAKILVYGGFSAAGEPSAPVLLGGNSFGGIHALGRGSVTLKNCALEGAAAGALSAWDNSFLQAERVSAAGCDRGLDLHGTAGAFLKDCSLRALRGAAARAADASSLIFSGGGAEGGAQAPAFELEDFAVAAVYQAKAAGGGWGLRLSGEASVILRGVEAQGSGAGGAALGGRAVLDARGCSFPAALPAVSARDLARAVLERCRGGGVSLENGSRLEARDCVFSDSEAGLFASGRCEAALERCGFLRHKGHAARLHGENTLLADNCEFSGSSAGLEAAGRNSVRLSACAFSGNTGPGVKALGINSLDLFGCAFDGGESGVEGLGRNSVLLRSCVFRGVDGPAADLERPLLVKASSCSVSSCGAGLRLRDFVSFAGAGLNFTGNSAAGLCAEGEGALLLEGAEFRGNQSGLYLDGALTAEIRGCVFDGNEGPAADLRGRVSGRLADCVFSGGTSGLKLKDRAYAAASRCSFDGASGSGVEASGQAGVSLEDSRLDCCGAAVLVSGSASAWLRGVAAAASRSPAAALDLAGSLCAAETSFSSNSDAAYCAGLGLLRLRRCALLSAGGAALNLRGGTARLEGCSLSGRGGVLARGGQLILDGTVIRASDYGVDCSAGLDARATAVEGGSRGGVLLLGCRSSLSDVSVRGAPYPGISAAPGARLKAVRVFADGAAWTRSRQPAGAGLKRVLFGFVAATAGLRPFSLLYRGLYSAAPALAALLLRGRGLRALFLYRGMARKDWFPGLSDMDLACVTAPASPSEDYASYALLRRRLRALRTLVPFTGEVMTGTGQELSVFFSRWGAKAGDFAAASRPLRGDAASIRLRGEPFPCSDPTEAFYAYTLLLRHFFSSGVPEPFLRRNCLKNLVDIRRYLDPAARTAGLSRAEYGRAIGLPLDGFMELDKGEAAYQAFLALHRAAPAAAAGAAALPRPEAGWFNRAAFETACAGISAGAGTGLAVVLDPLYRVYAILPDDKSADRAAYLKACSALREAAAAFPALGASPLVLTASAFARLSHLPYLNNPMFWADLAAPSSGRGPKDGGVYSSGQPPLQRPDKETLGASALAGAAHFRASWRSLWGEMPPHYFYTRAAGLRLLLETGSSPAFADPAGLAAACAASGIAMPAWESFLAAGAGRNNYEHVCAQCAALGRFLDGE